MTPDEFLSVRRWMIDRWPALTSLTNGQWIAYREELERFDQATVTCGLEVYLSQGSDFPPGVARLSKLCSELVLQDSLKALPPPEGISWVEYCERTWGEYRPLSDLVKGLP